MSHLTKLNKKVTKGQVDKAARRLGLKTMPNTRSGPAPNWKRIKLLLTAAFGRLNYHWNRYNQLYEVHKEYDDEIMCLGYGIDIAWNGKCYCITESTVIPGVRYTKNGDGWPDDVDVQELATFEPHVISGVVRYAAAEVAKRVVEEEIDNVFETEQAEEWARQEAACDARGM